MENGCSTQAWRIKQKLQDENYIRKAVKIISEQLVYFFYSEWEEDKEE